MYGTKFFLKKDESIEQSPDFISYFLKRTLLQFFWVVNFRKHFVTFVKWEVLNTSNFSINFHWSVSHVQFFFYEFESRELSNISFFIFIHSFIFIFLKYNKNKGYVTMSFLSIISIVSVLMFLGCFPWAEHSFLR